MPTPTSVNSWLTVPPWKHMDATTACQLCRTVFPMNQPAQSKENCVGIRIHSEELPTAEDCLQLCDATLGCRWFSFYSSVPECVLFKNCPSIDESSEDCISGERRCIDETSSSTTEMTSTTNVPPKSNDNYFFQVFLFYVVVSF